MIIPNGSIIPIVAHSPLRDKATGFVSPGASEECDSIPCQYIQKSRNELSLANGERVTRASYEILVEEQPLKSMSRLKLKDIHGNLLGEYPLQCAVEYLRAVGQIKITV